MVIAIVLTPQPQFSETAPRLPYRHGQDNAADDDAVCGTPDSETEDAGDGTEIETSLENAPNINAFSAALCCYPIVSQIAMHLDLNSLHDLSATCRQFRANMLQFRSQLVNKALRCSNEDPAEAPAEADPARDSRAPRTQSPGQASWPRNTSGNCARDMVGDCRRCGTVVCRNCIIKPPHPQAMSRRYRRLCKVCLKAPILHHATTSKQLARCLAANAFSAPAFERSPCSCQDLVFLCKPCGVSMASADIQYMRGWTWRTRYSTYLGGLGTGIGEGNEGVECGRGHDCLAAREVEKEIDCDAEELAVLKRDMEAVTSQGQLGRRWGGTSYMTQEMEGIGGVVKKKVKKRIRVGAVVKEYEDERESGDYLEREKSGDKRSWCSWCHRIMAGVKDRATSRSDNGLFLFPSTSSTSSSDALRPPSAEH